MLSLTNRLITSDYIQAWKMGRAINEQARPFGIFIGVARSKQGDIKEVRITKNLITNEGHAALAARAFGIGYVAPFRFLAAGEGKTPAHEDNVALEDEIMDRGFARVNATARRRKTTVENDTGYLQNTFVASATVRLSELGIFNEDGVMLSRKTFVPVELNETDAYRVEYGLQC